MEYVLVKIDRYNIDKKATCWNCGETIGEHAYMFENASIPDRKVVCRECAIDYAKAQ